MRKGIKYNKATKRYYINTGIKLSNGKEVHIQYRPKEPEFESYKYTAAHYYEIIEARREKEEEKKRLEEEAELDAFRMHKEDTFMNRLEQLMVENDLTNEELAEKLNIPSQTIFDLSTGKTEPEHKEILLIARELRVDPLWLQGYEAPKEDECALKKDINDLLNKLTLSELEEIKEAIEEKIAWKIFK